MWQKLQLNFLKLLFYGFLISLPLGTRFLVYQFTTGFHEYEAIFVYASDILLILFLVSFGLSEHSQKHAIVFPSEKNALALGLARPSDTMPARPARRFSQKFAEPSTILPIFIFLSATSVFLAFSKGLAVYSFVRLILLILFALATAKILKTGVVKLENVLAIVAGSAAFQALLGIFQFIKQSSLGLGILGEPLLNIETGGIAKIIVGGEKILRAYGTFPHPNVMAAFLLLGLISLYYLFLRSKLPSIFCLRKTDRSCEDSKLTFVNVILALAIFVVSLGLLLTFSRTSWAIAGLATIAIILFSLKSNFRQAVRLGILTAAILGIIFVAFNPYLLSRAKVSSEEPAVSYRLEYNKLALDLIKKNPLGIGIGNQVLYSVKNEIYQKFGMDQVWQWQPVHNIYLLIASEIGILGLLAFLFFVASILFSHSERSEESLRSFAGLRMTVRFIPKAMLIALLLFGLVDHFLWTLQPGRLMLWLIIGILIGVNSAHRAMDSAQPSEG